MYSEIIVSRNAKMSYNLEQREYKKTTRCKIESVNKNQDANEFPRKCVKYLVSFHIAAAPPL
jgi:hypothetical protein